MRIFMLVGVTLLGVVVVLVSGYYLLLDWAALRAAYARFELLASRSADLNALFVGLARSVGIPARDVYGVRVADSKLGYKALGKSGDITKAQHCRAEFYLAAYGWVPVDPADVRKVVLEESGGLPLSDAKVEAARKRLFGSWEMNWMAFNYAHDVQLPGAKKGQIGFFMYPNAEVGGARVDSLDPDNFKYKITSREIVS